MANPTTVVIGGVDTHKHTHYAAAIDNNGRLVGHREFQANEGGYRALLVWMRAHGRIVAIGVESSGSFGATLTRYLADAGEDVVEVNKPNRQARHMDGQSDPLDAVKLTLRDLARRWKTLDAEAKALSSQIKTLVEHVAPELVGLFGVSSELAGQFLVTAGDNAERIRGEAAFAKLCGVSPKPASSGQKSGRHRLNRGGDRAANSALYIVTLGRLRHHQPTRDYVERRTAEGLTKREIIRCLKRYIAREVFTALPKPNDLPNITAAA